MLQFSKKEEGKRGKRERKGKNRKKRKGKEKNEKEKGKEGKEKEGTRRLRVRGCIWQSSRRRNKDKRKK